MIPGYACPNGPHRAPEGDDEDLDVCVVCWQVAWSPARAPGRPGRLVRGTRDDEQPDALGGTFTPPDAHA